jgi:pantoate--beta-alanine ligase
MTQVVTTLNEVNSIRKAVLKEKSVGFVPTMGALHAGHAELMKQARKENDYVIVSIFVNPTQFDSTADLEKYPSTIESDIQMAERETINCVWLPKFAQIYPDQFKYKIVETELSKLLCGEHRPGHFDGMLTVVLKLLNIIKPTRAYFGEKDYQQLTLVRGLVKAFFIDTQIVGIPTVREPTGLAMSSRNLRLSPEDREKAPHLYKIISQSPSEEEAKKQLEDSGFKVDYVDDINGRRYAAAFLGDTRLIDNVKI